MRPVQAPRGLGWVADRPAQREGPTVPGGSHSGCGFHLAYCLAWLDWQRNIGASVGKEIKYSRIVLFLSLVLTRGSLSSGQSQRDGMSG